MYNLRTHVTDKVHEPFLWIALRWMPQNTFDDKSTLFQVITVTWANVDQAVCCLMASQGHNELKMTSIQENAFETWWRHQMKTFSVSLALCVGNSPAQRAVTWSFDVFFDLRLNKRLSKQLWGWWFDMPSRSLWRHCNEKSSGNWWPFCLGLNVLIFRNLGIHSGMYSQETCRFLNNNRSIARLLCRMWQILFFFWIWLEIHKFIKLT